MESIKIKGNTYKLPIFLPDATRAVTKSVDSQDIKNVGVKGVVVNTYHLLENPGSQILQNFNGIKNFMNYDGLVVSDSGGWQVFSLIHRHKSGGHVSDKGVVFPLGPKQKKTFTPEDSIRMQFEIGSDIIICLDDFSPPDGDYATVLKSVERTTYWAKRCKEEYLRIIEEKKLTEETRPHLYSVVQGGFNKELRKKSADELVEIGFDGYGFGGYVMVNGEMDFEIAEYIASVIPDNKVKFALGVGSPHQIAMCKKFGWDIFDCTLPTRDARHSRLYVFNKPVLSSQDLLKKDTYGFVAIEKGIYKNDTAPIDAMCDCLTCQNYSRAYIHHLFKLEDIAAFRLATIHNLRTYTRLIEHLS